jgi:hypothetical protein
MKKCPFCAEDIQDAAIVCKHCGRDLVPRKQPVLKVRQADWISTTAKWGVGIFVAIVSLATLLAAFECSTVAQERTPAPESRRPSPLAPGRRVYVTPSKGAVHPAFVESLKNWGRWSIVDKPDEANLIATLKSSGKNRRATMLLTLTREPGGLTLWQSNEETAHKIPYNSKNAFTRALEGSSSN